MKSLSKRSVLGLVAAMVIAGSSALASAQNGTQPQGWGGQNVPAAGYGYAPHQGNYGPYGGPQGGNVGANNAQQRGTGYGPQGGYQNRGWGYGAPASQGGYQQSGQGHAHGKKACGCDSKKACSCPHMMGGNMPTYDNSKFMKDHKERMAEIAERNKKMREHHQKMMSKMGRGGQGVPAMPEMGKGYGAPSKTIEEGLSALKERLNITDAQKAAWEAYAKAVTEQSNASKAMFEKMRKPQPMKPMAPGAFNFENYQKQRDAQIKEMEAQVKRQRGEYEASNALMQALTDEQKMNFSRPYVGFGMQRNWQ
ncbi:MAG: Spy/CpxP family protein refolding chaperone [Magnetococcales bacterium]|nr:Spy/CpxP family protein refolding chaperone [Magnetococcales bacterium]